MLATDIIIPPLLNTEGGSQGIGQCLFLVCYFMIAVSSLILLSRRFFCGPKDGVFFNSTDTVLLLLLIGTPILYAAFAFPAGILMGPSLDRDANSPLLFAIHATNHLSAYSICGAFLCMLVSLFQMSARAWRKRGGRESGEKVNEQPTREPYASGNEK